MSDTTEKTETTIPDDVTTNIGNAVDIRLAEMKAEKEQQDAKAEEAAEAKAAKTGRAPRKKKEVAAEPETEELPSKKDDVVTTGDTSQKVVQEKKPEGDGPKAEIPDELLEEAVKAGLSMRNARKFPDADSLREAITLLKPKSEGNAEGDKKGEATTEKSEIDKTIDALPDLDPNEYEKPLVEGFGALKQLAKQLAEQNKQQAEVIKGLTRDQSKGWMDQQIDALGDVAETVRSDAGKKAVLQKKFHVLKAGYAASGEEMTDEQVFQEAAQMVLGNDIAESKTQAKADAAKKRSTQIINRPSGQKVTPVKTAAEEAAQKLNEKFFSKQ